MTSGQCGDRLHQFAVWRVVRIVDAVIVARRVFARLFLLLVRAARALLMSGCR